jgi:hypothetical protein
MSFDYQAMYEDAKAELARLQTFKANHETKLVEIDSQIEAATRIANAAAAVIGEQPVASIDSDWLANADAAALHAAGISVAAKAVIDSEPDADLTAPMVRDALQTRGWNWERYSNPLSTLHTVLKRLAESGVINRGGDGKYFSTKRRRPEGRLPKPSESVRAR